ncbi:glycosyltransferase family 2 protein [Neobacillus drentensis]|uniref:glycosyltransferase family 2 protein n=1 Tax=Neobacillus drentensis TaxID=220684 RepID=UPI002FFF4D1C
MQLRIEEKITAIIKTIDRPQSLDILIKSIKKYYPNLPIIVADDSQSPISRKDVEYHIIPFDSGIAKGRNYLVGQVKTPYVLQLDDDFCFIKETSLEKLLYVLENSDIDIVGGKWIWNKRVHSYHGKLLCENGVLIHTKESSGESFGFKLYDIIHNFFLARTDTLKRYPWDDRLKVKEHEDYFLTHKGKIKVALHPEVFIYHNQTRTESYNKFRGRDRIYYPLLKEKHGILKFAKGSHFEKLDKKLFCKETLSKYLNHDSNK